MYIEFGAGTVPAPPLSGLMEVADLYGGTVAITAKGVSLYLPFENANDARRYPEVSKILIAVKTRSDHEVEVSPPQRAPATQRGGQDVHFPRNREVYPEPLQPCA